MSEETLYFDKWKKEKEYIIKENVLELQRIVSDLRKDLENERAERFNEIDSLKDRINNLETQIEDMGGN